MNTVEPTFEEAALAFRQAGRAIVARAVGCKPTRASMAGVDVALPGPRSHHWQAEAMVRISSGIAYRGYVGLSEIDSDDSAERQLAREIIETFASWPEDEFRDLENRAKAIVAEHFDAGIYLAAAISEAGDEGRELTGEALTRTITDCFALAATNPFGDKPWN